MPSGFGRFVEPVIVFVRDEIAIPNIGSIIIKGIPLLLTLFFFIWLNNIFGLIPFSRLVRTLAETLLLQGLFGAHHVVDYLVQQ